MVHGDRRAAGELRRRHAKSLYAIAYGVLWDSEVADAVVTQVFAQAERTGREFHAGAGSVFRWLSRITRLRAELAAAETPPGPVPPPPSQRCEPA
jgi:DNA-directed RNA polymerase specialized sigma24 family protein